ncbi:response regulator [Glaciimonas immobilis]|uniref:CheY-like chemotaxis protein n=1 Tax=Glaciimonas immobilis TaxID=728004 RepID=A0A840RRK8_9BURK|nr:response regulator [Glaciimonas immobilis]KAF3998171.1 response regulator [Glaciimonas immobilis]MBB5199119.1 CheY-like chemotaxis protein [Glaciimonas immobilis]
MVKIINTEASTTSPCTVVIGGRQPLAGCSLLNALADLMEVRFIIADDGRQELIHAAYDESHDIIIADLDMYGLDNFRTMNILRLDPIYHDVPMVVNSGLKEPVIKNRGGLTPNVAYIRKKNLSPVTPRNLIKNKSEKWIKQ